MTDLNGHAASRLGGCRTTTRHRAIPLEPSAGFLPHHAKTRVHGPLRLEERAYANHSGTLIFTAFDRAPAGWAIPAADLLWLDAAVRGQAVWHNWTKSTVDDIHGLTKLREVFHNFTAIRGEYSSLAHSDTSSDSQYEFTSSGDRRRHPGRRSGELSP